jgi:hypothetical protein
MDQNVDEKGRSVQEMGWKTAKSRLYCCNRIMRAGDGAKSRHTLGSDPAWRGGRSCTLGIALARGVSNGRQIELLRTSACIRWGRIRPRWAAIAGMSRTGTRSVVSPDSG